MKKEVFLLTLLLGSWNLFCQSNSDSTKKWVGTWSCAPYAAGTNTPPSPYLANNTFRQIVRVSIGGDTLRVKFSNSTCATAVKMNSVNIAVSTDGTGSAINISTMKQLQFSGNASVTINARSTVTSDPVVFNLAPNMRVAITIYYGQCQTSADMTHHYGSRTDSYILAGDNTTSADFADAVKVERWYTINSIEVWAPKTAAAVAVLGNSITDGYGLHGGLQNRWTDVFSENLLKNPATAHVSVLNLGIGATNVAGSGATTGASRYQQDILGQSGVHWVIIFYGVNDINAGTSAATIISTYAKFVADGHAKNVKVYGATITPFNGHSYYTSAHEEVRGDVNKWIRTAGNFDGFIDFDKAIRNPTDTTRLRTVYSNDWLHPNAAGYKLLGESVDLSLFTTSDSASLGLNSINTIDDYSLVWNQPNPLNPAITIEYQIPSVGTQYIESLRVYDIIGREVVNLLNEQREADYNKIKFSAQNLASGIYFYQLTAINREK